MKREYIIGIQGAMAAAVAFLSDKLGILFPVLCALASMMVVDYVCLLYTSPSPRDA